MNQFEVVGRPPEDAFILYCIDFGALALLNHFTNCDCHTWFTSDTRRSSDLIQKYLSTTEFYLALTKAQGPNLRYFRPIFDIHYDHRSIRFSAVFQIGSGMSRHSFLLESVRSFDLPIPWLEKLDEKLVPFAHNAKHWHRYFENEPTYLLLVENQEDALEAAVTFYNRVEKNNFRLITDEEVRKGLEQASFLKYIPGERTETGEPVSPGKLAATKSKLLSGAEFSSKIGKIY